MIAFLIALAVTLLWYFFDKPVRKVQPENQSTEQYWDTIRKDDLDVYKREASEKQPDERLSHMPLGIVYYSTPGKSYKRFIQDGRILNIDKTWPYPPNTP
ncbi:hypothetical protein GCM10028818_59680 [Spirosoma horti]